MNLHKLAARPPDQFFQQWQIQIAAADQGVQGEIEFFARNGEFAPPLQADGVAVEFQFLEIDILAVERGTSCRWC